MFNEVLRRLGIKRHRTTAYHPQANGLLERAHSTLKNSLRALTAQVVDWESILPMALMAMRCAISDIGISPSLLVLGEQMQMPALLLEDRPLEQPSGSDFVDAMTRRFRDTRTYILENDPTLAGVNHDIANPTFPHRYVWLKQPFVDNSLSAKYVGPYRVTDSTQFPVITIMQGGDLVRTNVDRLRPAYIVQEHQEELDQPFLDLDNQEDPEDPDVILTRRLPIGHGVNEGRNLTQTIEPNIAIQLPNIEPLDGEQRNIDNQHHTVHGELQPRQRLPPTYFIQSSSSMPSQVNYQH